MGDITDNLSRYEMRCQCGVNGKTRSDGYCAGMFTAVDIDLAEALQGAVDHFSALLGVGISLHISSGNRCAQWNKDSGGSADSQHQFGIGADHHLRRQDTGTRIDPTELGSYYKETYPGKYGIGVYSNRVHLDVRPSSARWNVYT